MTRRLAKLALRTPSRPGRRRAAARTRSAISCIAIHKANAVSFDQLLALGTQ